MLEAKNPTQFLRRNPVKVMETGKYNQVSIMIGYTDSEGMLLNLDRMALEKDGFSLKDLRANQLVPVNLGLTKGSIKHQVIAEILRNLYPGKLLHRFDVRFYLKSQ